MIADQDGQKWSFYSPTDGALLGSAKLSRNDLARKYGCSRCVYSISGDTNVCTSTEEQCSPECDACRNGEWAGLCQEVCSACQLGDKIYDFLDAEFARDSWDNGKSPDECKCKEGVGDPTVSHELQISSDWGAEENICTHCDAAVFFPGNPPIECEHDTWVCFVALGRNRTCVDVAMHEVSHLINFSERRLGIDGTSIHVPPIEEGFCDILGEGAESWFSSQGVADWVHGTGGTCLPTRNMADPQHSWTFVGPKTLCTEADREAVALPDHASMFNEEGGLGIGAGHFNATILGKMGYLLARPPDDPPVNHWGVDVYGVGEECVRKGFYSAFTHPLLPPDATFSDLWYPVLVSFYGQCGWEEMIRAGKALVAMGFWTPSTEMAWASKFAIAAEYYPTHAAHPYWVFMNIGGKLVAFARECKVWQSCPYTCQILGNIERGVSSVIYNDEIHVFALSSGSACAPIEHWKIGSDGTAGKLKTIRAWSDRTPVALNRNGNMYVLYRHCASSQVRFARYVSGSDTWEFRSTPITTPGAAGAAVADWFTYVFYPDNEWKIQYYAWANWDDDLWEGPSPYFPDSPYRKMFGNEPPGVEWYKDRIHVSYPNERTGGRFTVYASCPWPCWAQGPWTLITKVDGRDPSSLWVYLDGASQNDGRLYQFRGWDDQGVVGNVRWRWKASQ